MTAAISRTPTASPVSPWLVLVGSLDTHSRPAAAKPEAEADPEQLGRRMMREANAMQKANNSAAIIAHIRKAGASGISTTELAERTGLTRTGVHNHVKRLSAEGQIYGTAASNHGGYNEKNLWRIGK